MAKKTIYEFYPFTWEGGLPAMKEHLDIVKELGFTTVWLAPIYPSPRDDMGYDISDYCKIDRRFGTLADFDKFVKRAHQLGIEVLTDMVLNHTSTQHKWFREKPDYYCWVEEPIDGWGSLFGGSAWEFDEKSGLYYCHLFAKTQADLDWFPDGNINHELVSEFRKIVSFWMNRGVDGFRLDVPQSINKNFASEELNMGELITGDKAVSVINAVFSGWPKKPFLLMESLVPYGIPGVEVEDIIKKYVDGTPVDCCLNICLKEERDKGWSEFYDSFRKSCRVKGFALDLESHDSPRFTSRSGMLPRQIFHMMFTSKAQVLVFYQGQELGLVNPKLSWTEIRDLDMQARRQLIAGVPEEEVLKTTRAYARVPLPIEEYDKQEKDRDSAYNWFKFYNKAWLKA